MHSFSRAMRHSLVASTAILLASLAVPALAFNPNEGITPGTQLPTSVAQTPPAPRYVAPVSQVQMPAKPLYTNRVNSGAPAAGMAAPVTSQYYPPAPVPAVSPAPVAAPMMAAPAPVIAPISSPLAAPSLPPVDPAVAARARAMLAAEQAPAPIIAAPAPMPAFTPPAPVVAAAPVMPRAMPIPAPAMLPPPPMVAPSVAAVVAPSLPPSVVPAPSTELSDESRTILSRVPASLDKPKTQTASKITMDRVDPEIKEVLGQQAQEESFEAVGLSITVRRPGLDTNYELNRAYTSLMGGDTQTAIQTYKNILGVEPRNEDALFGLAATYHRLGQVEQARPFYGMLLKVNPNHREGLNNFLVLVSDESPSDALPELERLEARNPDFSPIPAQIAVVLDKMGYHEQAKDKMLRALEIAPENMSYRYNLAVMLDKQGEYSNAAALYRGLIQASLNGAKVPASTEAMQKRLNYIVTEMNIARTAAR